jgi:predicted acyl esterase
LHLDARDGGLRPKPPAAPATVTYSAAAPRTDAFRGAQFLSEPFAADTEITGPVALVLWVSSSVDDMDLFAALHVIDPDGKEVLFPNGQNEPSAASLGWLRVSQRKLDPALSKPWRPYHTHDEVQKLTPGEPVEAQVEILATSNVVRKGYRLRVDLLPWDDNPKTRYSHDNRVNQRGENTIHPGFPR